MPEHFQEFEPIEPMLVMKRPAPCQAILRHRPRHLSGVFCRAGRPIQRQVVQHVVRAAQFAPRGVDLRESCLELCQHDWMTNAIASVAIIPILGQAPTLQVRHCEKLQSHCVCDPADAPALRSALLARQRQDSPILAVMHRHVARQPLLELLVEPGLSSAGSCPPAGTQS